MCAQICHLLAWSSSSFHRTTTPAPPLCGFWLPNFIATPPIGHNPANITSIPPATNTRTPQPPKSATAYPQTATSCQNLTRNHHHRNSFNDRCRPPHKHQAELCAPTPQPHQGFCPRSWPLNFVVFPLRFSCQ